MLEEVSTFLVPVTLDNKPENNDGGVFPAEPDCGSSGGGGTQLPLLLLLRPLPGIPCGCEGGGGGGQADAEPFKPGYIWVEEKGT